jgi:hypothetical protein
VAYLILLHWQQPLFFQQQEQVRERKKITLGSRFEKSPFFSSLPAKPFSLPNQNPIENDAQRKKKWRNAVLASSRNGKPPIFFSSSSDASTSEVFVADLIRTSLSGWMVFPAETIL